VDDTALLMPQLFLGKKICPSEVTRLKYESFLSLATPWGATQFINYFEHTVVPTRIITTDYLLPLRVKASWHNNDTFVDHPLAAIGYTG
jgi:hypothetical protein